MELESKELGFGAFESPKDSRTIVHSPTDKTGIPLVKGGVQYDPNDITSQYKVGICTAISLVQERNKVNDKKYSADFQYLLQKIYFDFNWNEGSSIISALKAGTKFGFLLEKDWTYTTIEDRKLPYSEYIKKLQAVPISEVNRLISLCVDRIQGYAAVDISNSQSIASAIDGSKAGIICRYTVGPEWYTAPDGTISWDPKKIDPIRPPSLNDSAGSIGGHAIGCSYFDFSVFIDFQHPNTWGTDWDIQGKCNINWLNYKMTEAWVILDSKPIIPPFRFQHDLSFGMTSPDVKQLQILLNKNTATQVSKQGPGSIGNETLYFGQLTLKAVKTFQSLNKLPVVGIVGPATRVVLNTLLV